jgi:hypothetical protein
MTIRYWETKVIGLIAKGIQFLLQAISASLIAKMPMFHGSYLCFTLAIYVLQEKNYFTSMKILFATLVLIY